MLAIEIAIISAAPWFFWMVDAPFKAGITFVSEYSLIIFLRLIVISFFQWSLLVSITQFFSSLWHRIFIIIRLLTSSEIENNIEPLPANQTLSLPDKKGVGRPRKN